MTSRSDIMIQGARLASTSFFTASAYKKTDTPKFFARLLFGKDSPQAKQLMSAVKDLFKEEWGSAAKQTFVAAKANNKILLQDGAKKVDKPGFDETVYYVNADSEEKPLTLSKGKQEVTKGDALFYPGCYANVKLSLYTYVHQESGSKGVGCELKGVQFIEDGERLGGSIPASTDDFPDLGEDEGGVGADWDNQDPGAGEDDDDIPF